MKHSGEKRYEVVCPVCQKKIYVQPSLAMIIGLRNEGYGICSFCKSFLHLSFVKEKEEMQVDILEKYMKKRKRLDMEKECSENQNTPL